ncbi:DUF2191 domain-containing protein [Cellulomonas composti]|uniref:Antitoxin VapB39 n=1 Tax=Cellulomonas composti TaxID=266130 RepID=A0A511J7K9_9CELL|nr:DUF2191 domain-containing protein [Cellulomonas composti]GEL93985.1 hypothetical protein CCO02nite_06430 [Cellulomonas composti]
MRTTLDLDDTVLAAARALAAQEHTSLGRAVSTLALRGLIGTTPAHTVRGFPVFRTPEGHTITGELVALHRDDD